MDTKPVLAPSPIGMTIIAAALSIVVSFGLLTAVAGLFLQEGTPLQNVMIAEHACREFAFRFEREACMRFYVPPEWRCAPLPPGGEYLGTALRHSFRAASYHRHFASR